MIIDLQLQDTLVFVKAAQQAFQISSTVSEEREYFPLLFCFITLP